MTQDLFYFIFASIDSQDKLLNKVNWEACPNFYYLNNLNSSGIICSLRYVGLSGKTFWN